MNKPFISRRAFLRSTLMGSLVVSSAVPARAFWRRRGKAAGTLRFIFYTDVHARTEWQTPEAMMKAAEWINRAKADVVLAGGDLITDGFQSSSATVRPRWEAYMDMHQAINKDVYPVMGNHDLVAARPEDGTEPLPDPRAEYRQRMGLEKTFYAQTLAGYRFIVLDSIHISDDDLKYHGHVDEEQLAWLDQELSGLDAQTPIVLATHIPLITSFYQATEGATRAAPANRVVVNNRELLQRFTRYNLVLVLQGHLHVDEWLRWRNTTFITGGAVCARYWRGPWQGTQEGFGVVTLKENRVSWEYVDYGWEARRP